MAEYTEVIPPGQEGEINFEVDGKKVHGTFSKNATVKSNDPRKPRVVVSVTATIQPFVDIRPSDKVYLRGMFGESVSKELTIFSNEDKPLEIYAITSNIDDKITYKLSQTGEPGRYTLKLWKNPTLPTLNTWGTVFLYSNSEHTPEKIVQVNVTTRGAIVVQPSTLNFGPVKKNGIGNMKDEPVERSLTIFKLKGDFAIRDVEFSSDFYEANVIPVEDGKKYTVTVRINPKSERDNYIDEMIIKTDDPQEPVFRVRLLARGI